MSRRKVKGTSAKWYKSCLKQLPKKNCDALRAIAARPGTHARFRGLGSPPEAHADLVYANVDRNIDAEGHAHEAFARNNCREALNWALRAVSAGRAAIEHAEASGNANLVAHARRAVAPTHEFVAKKLPKCLKKMPSF